MLATDRYIIETPIKFMIAKTKVSNPGDAREHTAPDIIAKRSKSAIFIFFFFSDFGSFNDSEAVNCAFTRGKTLVAFRPNSSDSKSLNVTVSPCLNKRANRFRSALLSSAGTSFCFMNVNEFLSLSSIFRYPLSAQ